MWSRALGLRSSPSILKSHPNCCATSPDTGLPCCARFNRRCQGGASAQDPQVIVKGGNLELSVPDGKGIAFRVGSQVWDLADLDQAAAIAAQKELIAQLSEDVAAANPKAAIEGLTGELVGVNSAVDRLTTDVYVPGTGLSAVLSDLVIRAGGLEKGAEDANRLLTDVIVCQAKGQVWDSAAKACTDVGATTVIFKTDTALSCTSDNTGEVKFSDLETALVYCHNGMPHFSMGCFDLVEAESAPTSTRLPIQRTVDTRVADPGGTICPFSWQGAVAVMLHSGVFAPVYSRTHARLSPHPHARTHRLAHAVPLENKS